MYVSEKANEINALVANRIEIPVHYDLWMQGARFGKIRRVTDEAIFVQMDNSRVKRQVRIARADWEYTKIA